MKAESSETIQPALKILMLEDSDDDVVFIERALKKGRISYVKHHATTQSEYRDAIHDFKPDVILSDNVLQGFNSREALRICRSELGNTPFILVSGTASDEFAATCIREGADDYISKSNLTNLTTSIRTVLKKRRDEKERRESVNAIRKKFRELQTSNEALNQYVYTVTHALRSPMTTLMGLLNVAQQTYDLASMRLIHNLMQGSITKLDETLIGLLDMARQAHLETKKELINWQDLIQSIFSKLEYLDPDNRITKLMHTETAVPFYSDPARISLVLTNVITNAYVHRPERPEHESIIGLDIFTTQESALILVKDNGTGIRPDILPRVYEMFFKASTSRGAGLGLYIAQQAIEKLGGTLEITSKEGLGTSVRIEIPQK